MIPILIVLDLMAIGLLSALYAIVIREAQRGRDIVLELTDYKHLAEDMLPVLRSVLLFAVLFFACLCSMHVGLKLLGDSAR